MTDPTISALAFIGLVFALAAGARLLLRAALVLGLVVDDLAAGRERPRGVPSHSVDLTTAA
jgi:hypothetical protein